MEQKLDVHKSSNKQKNYMKSKLYCSTYQHE